MLRENDQLVFNYSVKCYEWVRLGKDRELTVRFIRVEVSQGLVINGWVTWIVGKKSCWSEIKT